MQASQKVDAIDESVIPQPLAGVVSLPVPEAATFYAKNSGMLPRLGTDGNGDYSRSSLPTPLDSGPDGVFSRVREFVRVNRPHKRSRR